MGYMTPELYVHEGSRAHRIEIIAQTIHKREQKLSKYVFPPADAFLISTIHDNKVYLLAHHFITSYNYVLY